MKRKRTKKKDEKFQEIVQEGADEEATIREREERIAALKEIGLNIGPSGGSRTRVDRKAEQKRVL